MSGAVIGIDLGTTFSCAAVYRKGKGPVIIPNDLGDRVIPSVVYYDPTNGDVYVGKNAIDEIPECPSNGLYDAKRIIGRKFDDEYISKFTSTNDVPFSIVRAENDQAAFQIEIDGKKVVKTSQEVSAEVLKYIKNMADYFTGCNVTEAVISVPAYFSNAQRKATSEAAELAGLKVLKLITEPTAAAIHYVSDKKRDNSQILVFDFGGGTLDVSIIKVNDIKFEVKTVYGDTFLGGRDIDEQLFKYLQKEYPPDEGIRDSIKRAYLRRLKTASVEIKKKLSGIECAKYSIPSCYGGEEDICLTLSREKFETITTQIFERAMDIVNLALVDSGISKADIDQVVLVGGTSKIPIIRDMLRAYFDDNGAESPGKLKTDIHPDEAVAAGASIQASLVKYKLPELEHYTTTEVTPLSLGIQSESTLMGVFIPRNRQIPCKVTKTYVTCNNNQRNLAIKVFEGERKNTEYNNLLAEFKVTELPRRRAGDVKVYVTFELDEDGILNVTAEEETTGKINKLAVTIGQFRLSERKIGHSVQEAQNNKYEDEIFEKFVLYKGALELKCKHIVYDLDRITSEEDKKLVEQQCRKFLNFCVGLDSGDITILKYKFAIFKNSVQDILRKYNIYLNLRRKY